MAQPPQSVNRPLQVFRLHEQVVRVEGRDGEDADPGSGQNSRQRGKDADDGERDGPGYPQTAPTPLTENILRYRALATNDGQQTASVVGGNGTVTYSINGPGVYLVSLSSKVVQVVNGAGAAQMSTTGTVSVKVE